MNPIIIFIIAKLILNIINSFYNYKMKDENSIYYIYNCNYNSIYNKMNN